MTYKPSYDRSAHGKFHPDRSFSQVRAGTDAYLLEDEANEMQAILREQARDTARQLLTSGVTRSLAATVDATRSNAIRIAPFEAMLDGVKVKVAGVNTSQTARVAGDGEDNLLRLGVKPAAGTRTDIVLLEVYEEEVRGGQTLFKYGAQSSDFTLVNDLIDPRVGADTARRIQVKSVLRVLEGASETDTVSDLLGTPFAETSPGLLKSGAGHLAIRLFSVKRTSTETVLAAPQAIYALSGLKSTETQADGSVVLKMSGEAVQTLQGVNFVDAVLKGHAIPILRYSNHYGSYSEAPMSAGGVIGGNSFISSIIKGYYWNHFQKIEYMNDKLLWWFDMNTEIFTVSATYTNENISVVCMQNATNEPQTFRKVVSYSSKGGSIGSGAAEARAYVIKLGDQISIATPTAFRWVSLESGCGEQEVVCDVPSGSVVVLVLRTCPVFVGTYNSLNYYRNYHGVYDYQYLDEPVFKPHLPTYRYLMNGKWD